VNIKVTNISDEHLIDVFIGTLKDNIQHEVCLWKPRSLENAFKVARNVESKNMAMATATRKTNPNIYRENNAPYSKTPQPTMLTPQQLEERKEKHSKGSLISIPKYLKIFPKVFHPLEIMIMKFT
jgi:hypothetical protein